MKIDIKHDLSGKIFINFKKHWINIISNDIIKILSLFDRKYHARNQNGIK